MKLGNRIPSLLKGCFFACRIHLIIPSKLLKFLGHIADLSKWISIHKKNCPNDFYTNRFIYKKRENLYQSVIESQKLTEIDYFEFGVAQGYSFKWWINQIQHPNARFYGFDTFTGLPEDFGYLKKGDFNNNNNKSPIIDDNRHQFYQGLFQQTLIPFLSEYKIDKRKVIHMDADIYSATLYVLTLITPYLKSGDIIFFDEFNVPVHEFKAFKEWSSAFYIEYEVLGGVNNFYQTAILIK